jgi:hypothetical protein
MSRIEQTIRDLDARYRAAPPDSFAQQFYFDRLVWEYEHAPSPEAQWLIETLTWYH